MTSPTVTDLTVSNLLSVPTPDGMNETQKLVYLAKLAENAERYDEMVRFMHTRSKAATTDLSVEERNLLSVGYKNAVGARRASLRIATVVKAKAERKAKAPEADDVIKAQLQLATHYEKQVMTELEDVCHQLLDLIENHLLKIENNSTESIIFFHKMKGDYTRYLSEHSPTSKQALIEQAKEAYNTATELAEKELCPTHPTRLGLSLNYSVHSYEIVNDADLACKMAQKAFDDAIKALDKCKEEHYRDSTLIMQLLRDNLILWQNSGERKPSSGGAQMDE